MPYFPAALHLIFISNKTGEKCPSFFQRQAVYAPGEEDTPGYQSSQEQERSAIDRVKAWHNCSMKKKFVLCGNSSCRNIISRRCSKDRHKRQNRAKKGIDKLRNICLNNKHNYRQKASTRRSTYKSGCTERKWLVKTFVKDVWK